MRVKHICIILLTLASSSLKAQDTLLLGKWRLLEMQNDSIIIFNRDNIELTLDEARNRQKPLDSATIKKFKEVTHPLMKKMFYDFLDHGSINAGVLDLENGDYVFVEKLGAYRIDGKKLGVSLDGRIDSYIYSIENEILTMTPIIGGEIYDRSYAKYEKFK